MNYRFFFVYIIRNCILYIYIRSWCLKIYFNKFVIYVYESLDKFFGKKNVIKFFFELLKIVYLELEFIFLIN